MANPPSSLDLATPIQFLKGIGPNLASLFQKLGVQTAGDLLHTYPRRYEDRTNLPPMNSLKPGQWATVKGRLLSLDSRPVSRGRVVVKGTLSDGRYAISLIWFNQPWVKRKLESYRGEMVAFGQVKDGASYLEIHSPEYELLDDDSGIDGFARIVPVYGLTEGLMQSQVRRAMSQVVPLSARLADPIPEKVRARYGLMPAAEALQQIHLPDSDDQRVAARRRLAFEEFLVLQLHLCQKREAVHAERGLAIPTGLNEDGSGAEALWAELAKMFPFEFTGAQRKSIREIWRDMERPYPMNRLLQGDVGSGKTAVAAAAMLAAVRAGYQAALMAPTEILAEQHAAGLSRAFEAAGIEVTLLVGKQTAKQRAKALEEAAQGKARVAVGTHALIQSGVEFQNLGLIVIDEQHRFGVLQRAALREKGIAPEVLVMTATPIPRTLTMTLYGDLDVSILDELPPGRRPIKTHWRRTVERNAVYEAVRAQVEQGKQAYIVCPLVEDSEKMQAQAATELYQRLSTQVFADLRVRLLHGQLPSKEKEEVMEAFRLGEVDILVATTVIEVGVDVGNACVMVIEDANRFGLSQLHQLRGRVGRSAEQSYCILVGDAKSDDAKKRMEVMVATTDGFVIAEKDLEIRGPGELAGTRQHGFNDLRLADLVKDRDLLEEARELAIKLIKYDPELAHSAHRQLNSLVADYRKRTKVV